MFNVIIIAFLFVQVSYRIFRVLTLSGSFLESFCISVHFKTTARLYSPQVFFSSSKTLTDSLHVHTCVSVSNVLMTSHAPLTATMLCKTKKEKGIFWKNWSKCPPKSCRNQCSLWRLLLKTKCAESPLAALCSIGASTRVPYKRSYSGTCARGEALAGAGVYT
jgi:hypothetical protein